MATPAHRSDPQLIAACLAGEAAAWTQLVDRYGRLVYSIPRRYGLSETDADDVFQNVFATAFRKLTSLKDQTRLSAWLITTAHRECWRVGKRSPKYEHLDQTIVDVGSPAERQIDAWERAHLVRLALERLGPPCHDLLTALFLEPAEASYETIADRLGMKVGSIGPTRARCFKKMEKILGELGFQPEGSEENAAAGVGD
jgi:RNA polymerase sigma factor (sigma-70 family)